MTDRCEHIMETPDEREGGLMVPDTPEGRAARRNWIRDLLGVQMHDGGVVDRDAPVPDLINYVTFQSLPLAEFARRPPTGFRFRDWDADVGGQVLPMPYGTNRARGSVVVGEARRRGSVSMRDTSLRLAQVIRVQTADGEREYTITGTDGQGNYDIVETPPQHHQCRCTLDCAGHNVVPDSVDKEEVLRQERRRTVVRAWALYLEGEVQRRGLDDVRRDLAQTEVLCEADQAYISQELHYLYDPTRGVRRHWTRVYSRTRRVIEL